jgi:hypothetical protein
MNSGANEARASRSGSGNGNGLRSVVSFCIFRLVPLSGHARGMQGPHTRIHGTPAKDTAANPELSIGSHVRRFISNARVVWGSRPTIPVAPDVTTWQR